MLEIIEFIKMITMLWILPFGILIFLGWILKKLLNTIVYERRSNKEERFTLRRNTGKLAKHLYTVEVYVLAEISIKDGFPDYEKSSEQVKKIKLLLNGERINERSFNQNFRLNSRIMTIKETFMIDGNNVLTVIPPGSIDYGVKITISNPERSNFVLGVYFFIVFGLVIYAVLSVSGVFG